MAYQNDDPLQQRYNSIMDKYHDYFEHVRVAFKQHCEDIKQKTLARLAAVPEADKEARKQILMDQKAELDQTLAELKQLLNYQSTQMRKSLEEIKQQQEAQSFDLEQELAQVA